MSASDKLKDMEDFWTNMTSDDGVYVVDSQQRLLFWSESAQRILGHAPEEVIGRLCYEVVGGRDARNFQFCRRNCPTIVNSLRGRATPNYDLICPSAMDEHRWLNVSTLVLKNKGFPLRVLHILRDVSHRRHIEEATQRVAAKLRQVIEEEINPEVRQEEPGLPPLPKLSPREKDTLRLLTHGLSTKEIALSLNVKPLTARNHVSRLLLKLGAENRLQAVLFASRYHLI
ncbi:MAG: PAS domain-containing protein [Chloroflexi bacterium]|nr:PAS domain-containing protein [Chloroflexota bacterium]